MSNPHRHGLAGVVLASVIASCGSGGSSNDPPTANAGADRGVGELLSLTLQGSGTDPDGTITRYEWRQLEGPTVEIVDAMARALTFTAPAVATTATLVFELTVTDNGGAAATDTVSVTVTARTMLTEIEFDDPNLGSCVLDSGLEFADEVTVLECPDSGIATTRGLEAMVALERLDLSGNRIQTIDLSTLTNLTTLRLSANALTNADLSLLPSLAELHLDGNELTGIDLSNNTALVHLHLSRNALTDIDLAANGSLSTLDLADNRLTTVDLTGLPLLEELDLGGNLLSTVDLTGNRSLVDLDLRSNGLVTLDVGANTTLERLDLLNNADLGCPDILAIKSQLPDLDLLQNTCGEGSWIPRFFEPAARFKDLCAEPRPGVDPRTGVAYPDRSGTTLDENHWLRSWSNDLYLWYDEITDRNPADFSTASYFALLKTFETTPSGNPKDRFHFTIDTEEWIAQSSSGVSAGYGFTLAFVDRSPPRRLVIAYTEPDSPAASAAAALARGDELLAIDGVDLVNGPAVEYADTVNGAVFRASPGDTHTFTFHDQDAGETRTFNMTAATITSVPVQTVATIDMPPGKVGYFVFNDHIATAEVALLEAVTELRDATITDLVVDLRYNGGGFLAIASQLAYMIAGPVQSAGKAFEVLEFNDKHPIYNPVTGRLLSPLPFLSSGVGLTVDRGTTLPSLGLERVFVLTGPGTCSASETIINGLRGIDVEVVQIGSTTCGKPYGFYPADNCGTTYFSIQFREVNEKGFGDYADGFSPANDIGGAGTPVPGCAIGDDFTRALGDPEEARLAGALRYRAEGSCPEPDGSARRMLRWERGRPAPEAVVRKPAWLTNRILDDSNW